MKLKTSLSMITIGLLFSSTVIKAEDQFTNKNKTEIIMKLAKALKNKYVLVKEGEGFGEELIHLNEQGAFSKSNSQRQFAYELNSKLREIANDKHLNVMPKRGLGGKIIGGPGPKMVQGSSMSNLPHIETEILPGNVGVLTINDLLGTTSEIDKAMKELTSTDSLLIDVRQCPGGDEKVVQQLMSYFIPENDTIIEMYQRDHEARLVKSKTLPVTNKRYLDKPIVVVTSASTGSGCEEISFDIKYHKLGYLYGENTAGAGFALFSGPIDLGYGLEANIPDTAPKHPDYDFTFEKVGVAPDFTANSALAFDKAYQLVLSLMLDKDKRNKTLTIIIRLYREIHKNFY